MVQIPLVGIFLYEALLQKTTEAVTYILLSG